MHFSQSSSLYQQSLSLIPGGVNSPVRAFKSVDMKHPLFISHAKGSKIYDCDGNQFIDYVGSFGPLILGHAHEKVSEALTEAIKKGVSYGAPTELEIELASLINSFFPSMELIRMVNSGTEASMSAIRLARAYTNKNKIVKFAGCYHGHVDSLLAKAGSGAMTNGIPDSLGVPNTFIADTLIAKYNSIESVQEIFENNTNEIAAVIIEPFAGNMGFIPPQGQFLQYLRELCDQQGVLLIFDEVMTGFRVAKGGAQELFHIVPDLTILGKIIGGGLPVGCYGGRKDIMTMISPSGGVYQAGTLSGNPLAMTAGITTLKILEDEKIYSELSQKTNYLVHGFQSIAKECEVGLQIKSCGSLFGFFMSDKPILNFNDALTLVNKEMFIKFYKSMLTQGIYFAPSPYESSFISLAHTNDDLDKTLQAFQSFLSTQ